MTTDQPSLADAAATYAEAQVFSRGVKVHRPTPRFGGDPERPIRLVVADVAYAELSCEDVVALISLLAYHLAAPAQTVPEGETR